MWDCDGLVTFLVLTSMTIRTSILLLAFVLVWQLVETARPGVQCAFKAETRAIWKTRNRVEYQGQIFDVAVNSEKKYALVQPKSAFDFANVEGVAGQVSGCDTRSELGILTSMTGNPAASISVRSKSRRVECGPIGSNCFARPDRQVTHQKRSLEKTSQLKVCEVFLVPLDKFCCALKSGRRRGQVPCVLLLLPLCWSA